MFQSYVKLEKYMTFLPANLNFANLYDILNDNNFPMFHPSIQLSVRRNNVFEDSYQLLHAGIQLKGRMQISMVSEQGHEETGIDGMMNE